MRIELRPGTVLIEPKLVEGELWQPSNGKGSVGVVRQSAYGDADVGDVVVYYPKAGLRVRSGDRLFLLLAASDLLLKVR